MDAEADTIHYRCGHLYGYGWDARCAVGKAGLIEADAKREGDHKTPIGQWPIRELWYRADRVTLPEVPLPARIIQPDDGWCDAPEDTKYNQHVKHPYPASAEKLWREDHVYDLLLVLGYNDNPPVVGRGSAIFFHLAHPDYRGTEGCLAIAKEDMLRLLPRLQVGCKVDIAC